MTLVPRLRHRGVAVAGEVLSTATRGAPAAPDGTQHEACQDIASLTYRTRCRVRGRVRSIRVQPWAGVATMECTLVDDTAGVLVVFLGRRDVPGVRPGAHLEVEGMVGDLRGRMAILNPDYELSSR